MAGIDGGRSRCRGARPPLRDWSARTTRMRLPPWWPVLVPVVVVLIGAWAYRWVDEDAFINFRIIANLLAGHGPVFNVGERVEVDSDPLWMFTLAALHGVLPFVAGVAVGGARSGVHRRRLPGRWRGLQRLAAGRARTPSSRWDC